jgi:nicotinate phosphoribosyltransferase
VQVFMALGEGELGAFRAYAEVYPDDCLLLVDTIDTLNSGLPNAIKVFEELRRKGHEPVGIRLDSGDLVHLTLQAARMLEDAGFPNVSIVLSSDLDEFAVQHIVAQVVQRTGHHGLDPDHTVQRLVFGVGTRLITSWGEPALGGVYKLVAVHDRGHWVPAIKVSESLDKTPNPGHKAAWRLYDRRGRATADLLSLYGEDPRSMGQIVLRHPTDPSRSRVIDREDLTGIEPLLVDVLDAGNLVADLPSIAQMRRRRQDDLDRLDEGVVRLTNPDTYHVSLTERLWGLKRRLVASAMEKSR